MYQKFVPKMKRITSLLALAFFTAISLNAKVWTVSFDSRPAQFTNIQTAHDTASGGDTILVNGYGDYYNSRLTITKPLTLIGETIVGATSGSEQRTYLYSITLNMINSYTGPSDVNVYGIDIDYLSVDPYFAGAQAGEQILDNVLIERCDLAYVTFSLDPSYSYSNFTFRNSIISERINGLGYASFSNFLITNCVIDGYIGGYTSSTGYGVNGNLVVRNSTFIDRTNTYCFQNLEGAIIENCIFYRSEPTGCTGCTFNNNLTFFCLYNSLPPAAWSAGAPNVGSGNIQNADPLWVAYPALGDAPWSSTHNYSPQAGSPALGTGTNGTNIGLTGGNAPVDNIPTHPKTPEVIEIDIPVSSVPAGGTLQINLKAKTRD